MDSNPTHASPRLPQYLWWSLPALFAAAFLLYARSFGNDWTLDDLVVIVGNPDVRSFSGFLTDSYPGRPLRELTFLLDHSLFGMQPAGWHIQSILWHGLNAVLLLLLALRLRLKPVAALLAAALFLVHPLHVEAVANLANRKDPLALALCLCALLAWLRAGDGSPWRWRLLAGGCFVLASLAKQTAIVLPLVVLLHEAAFLPAQERLLLRHPRRFWLVAAALGGGTLVWLVWFGGWQAWLAPLPGVMAKMNKSLAAGSVLPYLGMMVKGWGFMFVKILWPVGLAAEYVYPAPNGLLDPLLLIGLLVPGALVLLGGWGWRARRSLLFFGLGWFLLFWLPASNLWPLSYFAADRYFYAPLAGLALLAGAALDAVPVIGRRWLLTVATLAGMTLALLTWQQNGVWRNQATLWTQAVAVSPTSTTALTNLGVVHLQRGDLNAAQPLLEQAAGNFNSPMPYYHLGRLFEARGEGERAMRAYRTFLSFNDPAFRREAGDAQRRLAWLARVPGR